MSANQFRDSLREKWSAPLECSFNRNELMPQQVRTFWCDVDGDDSDEYCIQVGPHFMALADGVVALQSEDRFVHPVRSETDAASDRIDLSGESIRRIRNGRVQWERGINRRCWGLGWGRNEYDDVRWNRKWVGFHEEESKPIAMVLLNITGGDQPNILVFTSTGRIMIFDLAGKQPSAVQPVPGWYDKAQFFQFPLGDPSLAGLWAVTAYHRQRRVFGPWNRCNHNWVTITMKGDKAIRHQHEMGLACAVPGDAARFMSIEGNPVTPDAEGGGLREAARSDKDRLIPRSGLIACDLSRHDRVLLFWLEEKSRTVRVADADQIVLWEMPLGRIGSQSVKLEAAVLGTMGTPAEGMLAFLYSEEIKLPDYQTTYKEFRVSVTRVDGALLAEYQLPRGDGWSDTCVIFDDVDRDGKAEVLLTNRDRGLLVLELESQGSGHTDLVLPCQRAMAALPDFPLPPEDLWNLDLAEAVPADGKACEEKLGAYALSELETCCPDRQPATQSQGE